jgi:hypothetical protein
MSDWRTLRAATLGLIGALAVALLLSSEVLADESPTPEQQAAALASVPKDAQQYYQGYWYSTKIVADPLANWQPHKAPWQICRNDSYLGNSWRANLVAELQDLTSQLAKQGLAKDKLIVTNSNGDINLELTQLKTQICAGVRSHDDVSGLGDGFVLRHPRRLRQGRPRRDDRRAGRLSPGDQRRAQSLLLGQAAG